MIAFLLKTRYASPPISPPGCGFLMPTPEDKAREQIDKVLAGCGKTHSDLCSRHDIEVGCEEGWR